IVFSTHILADVEKICDRIAVLHGGKLALCGTLSEIRERHRLHGFILEFGSEKEASCFENAEELKQPSISLSRNGSTVKVFLADGDMDGHFLLDVLSQKHIVPLKFAVMEPTLESLFVEVIR
ncbi:MAG TPA: DUF4162 domain-containing protein, partial [Clostridiales bacterium]|nr:DUF4162 domain-containing protein [Clostridiales bacterium]